MAFEVSVFLENKITHLESITNALKEHKINIRSLTLTNMVHGWGVVNLLVDQPELAYKVLSDKGNSATLREVVAIEMKDEAGGLDEVLVKMARAGVHIENAYSRLLSKKNMAILILEVPDVLEASGKLKNNGIVVLDDETVYGR